MVHYLTLARRVNDARRFAEVVQILAKHGFADMVRRFRLHEGLGARVLRSLHVIDKAAPTPETLGHRLNAALTELGPTFIKLGQVLSTRPDLVGKTLADELGSLQDRVAELPFEELSPAIETTLGKTVDELFSAFNEAPVASASLSQVYRATLRSGPEVAVKIIRPNVRKKIDADISLLRTVAEWADENVEELHWIDLVGTVDEFERSVHRELDLTIEARTIQRFFQNFEDYPNVLIPQVHAEACSASVLTMDWVDGVRIDALEKYKERRSDPKTIANIGCETVCMQVFEHRLFHADPHPGNIWITYDNQLAFLDYGMVGTLDENDLETLGNLVRAVMDGDPETATESAVNVTTEGFIDDPHTLEQDIAGYIAFEAENILARGRVGDALERIADILARHELQLAPRFGLLIKALSTVESTAHRLDPDLDVVPIVRPYVEDMMRRRFSPTALFAEGQREVMSLYRAGKDIPQDVRNLLRMARRGRLKVQFIHQGLERSTRVLDHASNRIAFSVVTGSLIVGSSLLVSSGTAARSLGTIGFVIAGLLGFSLIISILRSRRY